MKLIWIYDTLVSSGITLSDAKGRVRAIQASMNNSSGATSSTAASSYSGAKTVSTRASNQGYSSYSAVDYTEVAASTYSPANSTSYSSYQPASYAGLMQPSPGIAIQNGFSASNNASYSDQYVSSLDQNRRLSAGSVGSSSVHRTPTVPSGAPEQLYRAESFYRAPASTVIPPQVPPKSFQQTTTTSVNNNYVNNVSSVAMNTPFSSSPQAYAVPSQPTRGIGLPVYKDPLNGATISQPNPSRTSSSVSSRTNSRTGTPERMRDFSASNALIEGMLQGDDAEQYQIPTGFNSTKSSVSTEYFEDKYSSHQGIRQGVYSSGSPTSVYSSSQAISSNSSSNVVEPLLTRIPASKLSSGAGSSINGNGSASNNSYATSSAVSSNNPFDSFC